jgi:hypothetical protein
MITLAFVAVVAVVALGLLARKWKSGAASIVLGALPMALLFLVLPIAPAIWGMIRGFQQMAQSGTAGVKLAAALCLGVSRPLFWGSLAFVGLMGVAAMLQALSGRDDPELSPDSQAPNGSFGLPEVGLLVATSLLVIPSIFLVHRTVGIPRIVMSAARQLSGPAETAQPVPLEETSTLISSRLVSSMLTSIPLGILLIVAVIANLFALRSSRPPRWLTAYSWGLWAVSNLLAVWNAIQLNGDIRSIELALT